MVRTVRRCCVLGLTFSVVHALPASGQGSLVTPSVPVAVSAAVAQGEVSGTIRDDRGRPLMGVTVSAVGVTLVYDVSDKEGRYAFRSLPPGTYLIRAHLVGYVPSRGNYVQVNAGSQQVWPISMSRAASAETPVVMSAGVAGGNDEETGTAGSDATPEKGNEDLRWHLARIRRGVLKESNFPAIAGEDDRFEESFAGLGRALGAPARIASAFFDDLALSGQVDLLTTTSFDRPQDLFSANAGAPRPIAYVALVAPAGNGEWSMRGSMTEGDIASWILAGSYKGRASAAHRYEAGLFYATQRYQGGNAEALATMSDGSRNAGEVYVYDTWTISPQWTVGGGGKAARYAYLDDPILLSGRMNVAYRPSPDDPLTLRVSAAHRQIAPGAEEFLPPLAGVWLPPERTFSSLGRGTLRAERVNHIELAGERPVGHGILLSMRAFRQDVSDQMSTVFGVSRRGAPATPGHYRISTAGSFESHGWGMGASREAGPVRASVDYTLVQTRPRDAGPDEFGLSRLERRLRRGSERVHDLTATVNSRVALTATRFMVVYKLNSAYVDAETLRPSADARFEIQVNQEMPFLDATGARWEMLVGIRNLFRSELFDGSVYDELMVVSPPKRVMGGVTVRF
jgi:hypothetical protein